MFHDGELDRFEATVSLSNQTLKADEANYRSALALIAEARAGLLPSLNFNPTLTRAGPPGGNDLNAEITGSWTLDVWGRVRRQIEQEGAAAQVSAADLDNARLSAQSSLASAYIAGARGRFAARSLCRRPSSNISAPSTSRRTSTTPARRPTSDVITAQAQLLAAQAQEINTERSAPPDSSTPSRC